MTQNKKFAVTGGIGSGKSLFCAILREKGYPVFSCDEISHELRHEEDYLAGLRALFPAYVTERGLDARGLSALVFSDDGALARLNAYSHPRIMERLFARMEGYPVSFAEVPLLYEGGFEGKFNGVIAVRREREARVSSVMARDGLSAEEVKARLARQTDDGRLETLGCAVVENNGSRADLVREADRVLARFGLDPVWRD